jgi:hypothetical protein
LVEKAGTLAGGGALAGGAAGLVGGAAPVGGDEALPAGVLGSDTLTRGVSGEEALGSDTLTSGASGEEAPGSDTLTRGVLGEDALGKDTLTSCVCSSDTPSRGAPEEDVVEALDGASAWAWACPAASSDAHRPTSNIAVVAPTPLGCGVVMLATAFPWGACGHPRTLERRTMVLPGSVRS